MQIRIANVPRENTTAASTNFPEVPAEGRFAAAARVCRFCHFPPLSRSVTYQISTERRAGVKYTNKHQAIMASVAAPLFFSGLNSGETKRSVGQLQSDQITRSPELQERLRALKIQGKGVDTGGVF